MGNVRASSCRTSNKFRSYAFFVYAHQIHEALTTMGFKAIHDTCMRCVSTIGRICKYILHSKKTDSNISHQPEEMPLLSDSGSLFELALKYISTPYHNPIIENFKGNDRLFIAVNIDNGKDLKVISALASRHPDIKFIINPYTISKSRLDEIQIRLTGKSMLYSDCKLSTDFKGIQSLVIDYIGDTPYIYRFASWCYIGRYVINQTINAIQAMAYGIPVSYGTTEPFNPLYIGNSTEKLVSAVNNSRQLNKWFNRLRDCGSQYLSISEKSKKYVKDKAGHGIDQSRSC